MATTKAIQILQRRCVSVIASGLVEGEKWHVQYALVAGCNGDHEYVPYHEDGKEVVLDAQHSPLTLWRPGWYRFVSEDGLNPSAVVDASEPFDCTVNAVIDNVAAWPDGD